MKQLLRCLTRRLACRILTAMSDEEFVKLYEQHAQALWCFVRSRDPHRTDDVCQETWQKVWEKRTQYKDGNFKAWLFRIARNHLIDESRKKTTLPLSNENDPPDAHTTNTLDAMIDQERKAVVAECMKKLSPEEATVVRMRSEGWGNEEIAEKLGVSAKRVHTLYFQAKQKLILCVERKLP
jgi:RNA polymerase sigma factor (sigma-70 family)